MTACRKRPHDYFRFNPPQGLGDLDLADYMSEGTIIEITNVWLRSPDGKDSTSAAYEKVKVKSTPSFLNHSFANSEKSAYEARKN
jgi:hypothetical protein